jgi:hypothetical protein
LLGLTNEQYVLLIMAIMAISYKKGHVMACLNLCFTNSTYDLGMLWNGREIKVAFCLHLFIAKKKALPLEFHQQTWSQKNNNIGDFMGWVIHTQIWSLQQFSCWEAHSKASSKIEGLFQACFQ